MASEIHQNDVGTRFLVTVKDDGVLVNVSGATLRQINIKKPDDSVLNRTASIISDWSAVSGVMYYDTVAGDLDEAGQYKLQAKVAIPSGTYYTDVYSFKVHCNI
tara:strand:+ start:690 stop:1001 length:312 start_codon:yes stop_codon:yes gene_type:complete